MGGAKSRKDKGTHPANGRRAVVARRMLRAVKSCKGTRPVGLRTIRVIRAVGSGLSPLAPISHRASARKVAAPELGALLTGVELGTWALGPKSINALVDLIARLHPAQILEFGSGSSTVVLAWALRDACGRSDTSRIVSIEQDAAQADRTRSLLAGAGLADEAVVYLAPLIEQDLEGNPTTCYGLPADLAAGFHGRQADLVVIDGPAGPPGVRFGTLPLARPFTRPGATFVLDDALRDGELGIAQRWDRLPYARVSGIRLIEKGLLVGRFEDR
jgi:predicted O-methyltransferase YrrM